MKHPSTTRHHGWLTDIGRWAQLVGGLFLYGLAIALMIRSGLGLGPWDAFHVGLNRLTGISVGAASVAAGAGIVGVSWLLGIRPGIGTLANMFGIGVFIDACLLLVPEAGHWAWGGAFYLVALLLVGLGSGMYIAAGLGKGPRDGLVVGLAERSGWTVRRVRTVVEISVLALGWSMGGSLGVGTLMFALAVGPSMQWGMQLFGLLPGPVKGLTAARRPRAWVWRRAA